MICLTLGVLRRNIALFRNISLGPHNLRIGSEGAEWPIFEVSDPIRMPTARTPSLRDLGRIQRSVTAKVRISGPSVRQFPEKSVSTDCGRCYFVTEDRLATLLQPILT